MYFINHNKQVIVFWFYKCGHTSLIEYFKKVPNFEMTDIWNSCDSYTYIQDRYPEFLNYKMAMVVRNPIYYSISGYKHFIEYGMWNHNYKNFISQTMINRHDRPNYTYKRHLELVATPNNLLKDSYINQAADFYMHCCINPKYTYRKHIEVIQLEKINNLKVFLENNNIKVNHDFPHSNRNRQKLMPKVNSDIVRLWDMLYRQNFELFGYDFDKTVNEIKLLTKS